MREAAERKVALRDEPNASRDALAKAPEAETAAAKLRDEARLCAQDQKTQNKAVASELESTHARTIQLANDAQIAHGRADEAEKRVRELQALAEELQRKDKA